MSKEEIEKDVIKNAPQKIYLQIGEDVEPTENFDKLVGVSWCQERINKNDIEYVLSNQSGWSDEDMVLFAMFNYKRHQFTTKDNLEEFKTLKKKH